MTETELISELERVIDDSLPADCARLIGQLETVKARALARMLNPPAAQVETTLTVEEVARELRVKQGWVREKARRKELDGFKTGKDWKFKREAVDRFTAKLEGKPIARNTAKRRVGSRKGTISVFRPTVSAAGGGGVGDV